MYKNNLIYSCILFACFSLGLSSCSNNKELSQENNEFQSVHHSVGETPPVQNLSKRSEGVNVDQLIGASLLSYPEYRPVNDDFSESLFHNRAKITNKNASMPIYRIEIDKDALNSASEKLQKMFNLKEKENKGGVLIYSNGGKTLAVNAEIGSLRFLDSKLFQVETGVSSIDKTKILKVAQGIFEDLIPAALLKNTYFYRYGESINSISEGDKKLPDLVYEVAVGLNTTVDGIPVIGSGGKYGLDLAPNGEIASIDMQFARFIKTDDVVRIKDSTSVLEKTRKEAESSGVSFENYKIPRAEFGYVYQSKKGPVKWLVPAYSIFIAPRDGVAGSATAYFVPASDDPVAQERFNEDVRAEENRKALHYEKTGKPLPDAKIPDLNNDSMNQPNNHMVVTH